MSKSPNRSAQGLVALQFWRKREICGVNLPVSSSFVFGLICLASGSILSAQSALESGQYTGLTTKLNKTTWAVVAMVGQAPMGAPVLFETSRQKQEPITDQKKTTVKKESGGPNEIPEPEAKEKEKKRVVKPATDRTDILNELTFDDLKFEMEKGGDFKRSMLTDQINDYNGTTVRIRGYIQPNYKQSGLSRFVFVRDNQECCFGPQAAIFDNILVKLRKGSETDYTVRPVVVEGKFALKEYKGPDGKIWSLYRMYEAKVK